MHLHDLAMPRYVILYHRCPSAYVRASHWDLMLEEGEHLRTWALVAPPETVTAVDGEALANHRTAYLTFEGPLDGDRGSVQRWDAGIFEWLEQAENRLVIKLDGTRLRGVLAIDNIAGSGRCHVAFKADSI